MGYFFKIGTLCFFLIIGLTACTAQQAQQLQGAMNGDHYKPLNILPMYGAPLQAKTAEQKRIDKEFIESIVKSEGSREVGAKRFVAAGWMKRQKGDARVSMMRFNQAWLLNPEYYGSYWGFGTLMLDENKPEKASFFFEKAMVLIDEERQKPRLFVEVARAYAWQASIFKDSDSKKAKPLFEKANSLIDQALALDSQYHKAYYMGALISFDQMDYIRAWNIVKKSRETGAYKFTSEFVEKLSKELPEP
ncbi:MAG: hypothetical protein R8M46_06695 [Ghiorsea sp.]